MAEKKSIYNRIREAMTAEGTMPEGFVLRERLQDGRQFADGAIDGTIRYYMGPASNTDITMLEQALKHYPLLIQEMLIHPIHNLNHRHHLNHKKN